MFSILLTTYNRHKMLKECLQMLVNQTYKDFEVFVCDRGSEPSVEYLINELNDKRFKYFRSSQDIDANDSGNEILAQTKGDYFAFLADDDGWLPSTFELVHKMFQTNDEIGLVQTGILPYSQISKKQNISFEFLNFFNWINFTDQKDKKFFEIDGKEIAFFNFQHYGIGEKNDSSMPIAFHPTSIFLRRDTILKILEKQKELFIKPFGDSGYNGIALNSKAGIINLPLSIMGLFHERESDSISKNRKKWAKYAKNIEFAPLHNSSFQNIAQDLLLKVIYRNGFQKEYKPVIQKDYIYEKELQAILNDNHNIYENIHDIIELYLYLGFWFFLKKLIKNSVKNCKNLFDKSAEHNLSCIIKNFIKISLKKLERILIRPFVLLYRFIFKIPPKPKGYFENIKKGLEEQKENNENIKEFANIIEFANWAEENFVKSYSSLKV